MLQVTFRNLLPSESLIEIAQHEYRQLHAKNAAQVPGMSCSVTIANRREPEDPCDDFRVRVEIMRGGATALSAVSEGVDVGTALRAGMVAAASLTSLTFALRAAPPCV